MTCRDYIIFTIGFQLFLSDRCIITRMNTVFIPDTTFLREQEAWVQKEVASIGNNHIIELIQRAYLQRTNAYAPYSHYLVGAALLTVDNQIYTGANAERVSYSETDHAEQSAINTAINAGEAKKKRKFLRAIAVVHEDSSAPCGHCRQIIFEHCDNCLVIVADLKKSIRYISSIRILLPQQFTPDALNIRD